MVYHRMLNIVPCALQSLFIHLYIANLLLLIPNSQSFPPSPCPLGNSSLFSMSVSLFLFHREVHLCHISDSIDKWCHIVFVFLFLTYSLSMIISRFIHVAVNVIISLKSTAIVKRVFLRIKGSVNKEQARQHRKIKNTHPHLLTTALSTVCLRSQDLEEVKPRESRRSGHKELRALEPSPTCGNIS